MWSTENRWINRFEPVNGKLFSKFTFFWMNGKRLFSVKDFLCSINPYTWDYRQAKRQDTYIFICKCTLTCWMEASVGDPSTLDQRICLPHRSEKNDIYFQGRKSWGYKSYGQMTKTALIYAQSSQIYGQMCPFKLQPWPDFMPMYISSLFYLFLILWDGHEVG